jgi:hypothetical protein
MTVTYGTNVINRYTPMKAKDILGVGKNTMYDLINNKEIDHIEYAGKTYITDEHIKDFWERNTVRHTTPKLYPKG